MDEKDLKVIRNLLILAYFLGCFVAWIATILTIIVLQHY